MRSFVLFALCAVFVAVAYAKPDGKYTTKYDNIDLDEILSNDRLLQNYYKCVMGQGKCTPDGEELKKNIPDALTNKCAGCSDKQKEGTRKVIKYLAQNKPDMFKSLEAKFDPQGTYRKDYQEELKKEGITLP